MSVEEILVFSQYFSAGNRQNASQGLSLNRRLFIGLDDLQKNSIVLGATCAATAHVPCVGAQNGECENEICRARWWNIFSAFLHKKELSKLTRTVRTYEDGTRTGDGRRKATRHAKHILLERSLSL